MKPKFNIMYDLIIIGGGPAGITAGIYAARKKIKTLLITKDFFGQVVSTKEIENYPGFEEISGMELSQKFFKHLKKFEIDIKKEELVKRIKKEGKKFRIQTDKNNHYQSRAVLMASGRDPRPLEVPGEKELIGKGVSYCEVCDGPLFKDKKVAVIGGGNAGFETALDLANYTTLIHILEISSKIRADELLQERIKYSKKIKVILNAKIKEIKGKEKVEAIVYLDRISKKEFIIPIDGIFVQIGSIPATGFVKKLVDFNKSDEIKIDPKTGQTKTPGLFAAGDVTDIKDKQIIVAAGEGAKAALSVYEYLSGGIPNV